MHTGNSAESISTASSSDTTDANRVAFAPGARGQSNEFQDLTNFSASEEALGWLDLRANRLGTGGARTLSHMRHLATIDRLILCGNEMGNEGVEALMASPYVSRLKLLDLRGNRIGPAGVRAIASCPFLTELTTLKLDGNLLTDDAVRILADSARLPALRTLSLGRCRLTDRAAWALAASSTLRLEFLNLKRNRIRPAGVQALVSGLFAPHLRQLILCRNPIADDGAECFTSSRSLIALERLDLTCAEIGDRGAVALSRAAVPSLRVLQLGCNHISGVGLEALRQAPGLSKTELTFAGNHSGD
jgi:Ran GTPase-activating protein (RanGAP) involved in mRNA processing and transport